MGAPQPQPKPKPKPKPTPSSGYMDPRYAPKPRTKPSAGGVPGYIDGPHWQGEWDDMGRTAASQGAAILGQAPVDPYGGASPLEAYMALLGGGVNGAGGSGGYGGGRGGSGGGGSGAAGNPDPMGWSAIAQEQNMQNGYAAMLAALDAKNTAVSGGFDARSAALGAANTAGQQNLAGLLAGLQTQAQGAAQNVAGTYGAGDAQLQDLMSQYTQMSNARAQPAQATLTAFGADPSAVAPQYGVQDMLTAQRANMARVGQADQALLGTRQNVYNGLNQDVTTQRQQGFDALTAKLLADRQVAEQDGASQRAQLAMQQQQALLQLQAQEQARRGQYA